MDDGICLQSYLSLGEDWPFSLVSINSQRHSPIFTSRPLFDVLYIDRPEGDFFSWKHHRLFNEWQNDIYSMDDDDFQFYWPLIAGALCEHRGAP